MLTVWATLISMVLTVQATIFLAFSRVLNGLSHPIFYGAYCSSHHVISLSRVLTVWATLFSMVLTVQATIFLAFSRVLSCLSHPISYGAYCSSHHVRHPVLYGANCSSHRVVNCYVSHPPFFMVLTVRASVIFLPSGAINVWGTAILFISLQVYN